LLKSTTKDVVMQIVKISLYKAKIISELKGKNDKQKGRRRI
jgi:hypothetical protein